MIDSVKTDFFRRPDAQQAPASQQLLELISQALVREGQHVVCSVPGSVTPAGLYSFAALIGAQTNTAGLAVVVCPDQARIQKNMAYFEANGFGFPDVAALDGHQMPHEERDIHDLAKKHRVKLLYTTPEELNTLGLMELMVHAGTQFIAIEQAELLLDDWLGAIRYAKLKEALSRFRKTPPLLLLVPPLAPGKLQQLIKTLNLQTTNPQLIERAPGYKKTYPYVHLLATEHQKFKRLTQLLMRPADEAVYRGAEPSLGKLFEPGSVLIETADFATCEKLIKSLDRYGFQRVLAYHPKMTAAQKQSVETAFATQPHVIVVHCGLDGQSLKSLPNEPLKLIKWQTSLSVDEAITTAFRLLPVSATPQASAVYAHWLYTKDDYRQQHSRLAYIFQEQPGVLAQASQQLGKFRQWVLSQSCRRLSLMAYLRHPSLSEMLPCDQCDRCYQSSGKFSGFRRFLRQLIEPALY